MAKHSFRQLDVIRKVAATNHKVSDCYQLLYKKELYHYAYYSLKKNDSFIQKNSRYIHMNEWVERHIDQFKKGTFRFTYVQRKRKHKNLYGYLGNVLSLEIIRMILLSIYQLPYFQTDINRYAIHVNRYYELKLKNWQHVRWIITGNGRFFIESFKRNYLLNILAQKIADRRFLSLIEEALSVEGLIVWKHSITDPLSYMSPQLATFFIHLLLSDFDNDLQFPKIKYFRHLDELYIGVEGSIQEAEHIKKTILNFFQKQGQLEFDRTEIKRVKFSDKCSLMYVEMEKKRKYSHRNRTNPSTTIQLNIPKNAINTLCSYYRYGHFHPFTIYHRTSLVNLTERNILNIYNDELTTIFSLYHHASNQNKLKKLYYVARSSFIKTIALKRKTTTTKVTQQLKSYRQGYYSVMSYDAKGKMILTHFVRWQDLMGNHLLRP